MMPSVLTLPVTEGVLLRPSILEGSPPAMVLLYSGPSGRESAHRSQASSASSQRASAWPKPWPEYTVISRVHLVVRAPIVRCVVLHVLVYVTVFPPP